MERKILHIDADCFYASVECFCNPEIRDKPVAIAGDPEKRHGIILTANYIAKRTGIKTGEAIWKAREKCPDLVVVKADMKKYRKFSDMMREIISEYSDYMECFGCDEAWIDVSYAKDGECIAKEIKRRIKIELGITVSIGVSFNKVFAKLASDYDKPDGLTVITKETYKTMIYNLNVSKLLYVGRNCLKVLNKRGVNTIGELAATDKQLLKAWLGKQGELLYNYANGNDMSDVGSVFEKTGPVSVSNSITLKRDVTATEDVKYVLHAIAYHISGRLRDDNAKGRVISVYVKSDDFSHHTRQKCIENPTSLSSVIYETAYELFDKFYDWKKSVRSLGIAVGDLRYDNFYEQMDLFGVSEREEKRERLEKTLYQIENRFGKNAVCHAVMLKNNIFDFCSHEIGDGNLCHNTNNI